MVLKSSILNRKTNVLNVANNGCQCQTQLTPYISRQKKPVSIFYPAFMNQWQSMVDSNVAGNEQYIKTARQRLTPAHIAFGIPPLPEPMAVFHNARVSTSRTAGRQVIADKRLEQGITVLVEQPFVHEIDKTWIGKRCSFCLDSHAMILCRQCKLHRYCSAACERNNWTTGLHSIFCSLYGILDGDHILAIKAYIKSTLTRPIAQLCFNTMASARIPNLISNIDLVPEPDIKAYNHSATMCAELLYWPTSCIPNLVQVMAQIRCNRFAIKANITTNSAGIIEHRDAIIGSAVYEQASMFNHSCVPNAFVTFNGPQITVRCTTQVQMNAEINISYGPLASRHARFERQSELAEKYLFECNCDGCQHSEQGDGTAYRCPSGEKECIVYRHDRVCKTCGQNIDWAKIDQAEKLAEKLKETARTTDQLLKLLELQQRIYNQASLSIGSTYDQLAAIYANDGDFTKAVKYCSLSVSIVKKHYGEVSIESADEHFKLATLLFNRFDRKEAYTATSRCINLFQKLGLDQARKEDMQELMSMMYALEQMYY